MISREELYDMYWNKEMSIRDISKKLDVYRNSVFYLLNKYGIERRTVSEAQRGRPRPSVKGKLHGNWKGGISSTLYCYKFNDHFRELIRNRDNNTCQRCDFIPVLNGKKLSIHHIHYDKPNCYPDVITLCQSCNAIVNHNRDYWEKHFEDQLRTRGLLQEDF